MFNDPFYNDELFDEASDVIDEWEEEVLFWGYRSLYPGKI